MSVEIVNVCQSVINEDSIVVNHAHVVLGQPQRKGVSPAIIRRKSLKYVKNVSLGSLGGRTKSHTNVERGLHPPIPNQTKLDQVTDHHQLLCKSPQEPLSVGDIASADKQKYS